MKKTWIKVKRGILEPKHRRNLGAAWFLYFYMLDKTNWENGIIYDWTDDAAAQELEIPLPTLRDHRRKLEDELYIQTTQKQYHLEIAITNWTNPREYSGQEYNKIKGYENPLPEKNEGDNQDYTDGDTEGNENLTPLHSINRITKSQNHRFVGEFLRVSEIPGIGSEYHGEKLVELKDKYGEDRLLKFADWCKKKGILIIEDALKAAETALPKWQETQVIEKKKKKVIRYDPDNNPIEFYE